MLPQETKALRRWNSLSGSRRQAFQHDVEAGRAELQRYLAREWETSERDFGVPVGSTRAWLRVRKRSSALLSALKQVKARAVLGDSFTESLDAHLKQVTAEAALESQQRYRTFKLLNRRRVYWVAALLPYLVFKTGKPRWDWLTTFVNELENQSEAKPLSPEELQTWWSQLLRRMTKDFPPKRVGKIYGIPSPPPVAYPPFDAADAYLEWSRLSRTSREVADYLVIAYKHIPFFSHFRGSPDGTIVRVRPGKGS